MMKLEFILEKGKIKTDLYKDVEGFKIYDFTAEDWEEAVRLLNKSLRYLKEEGIDIIGR